MDDILPSYETAIDQDPWERIAQYLPSDVLCSAALVCRKWHQTMTPQLWGSPASHFGVQNDTVYVALTRFKRILPYARPLVRELTHTLKLPPAHVEIYGGPHAEWLRDCLEYLPRLQCLLVNGLPFFDHAALLCLRHASVRRRSAHPHVYPVFGLRLLDASGCTNATSTGLAEALCHLPNLVSLDLSQTPAAKDDVVLSKLRFLRSLRLLNLRGLGLRDADLEIIAPAVGTRLRSLDVADNNLTDASARLLLGHCVKEEPTEVHTTRGPLPPVDERFDNDFENFESENVAGHVRHKLTGGLIGSLAIETARDVGITHLYLSKNTVTVEGISGLLRSRRLQVLDIGTMPAILERPYSEFAGEDGDAISLPQVSKLTPIIFTYASSKLRYLRVNYKIITEDAPMGVAFSPRPELSGDYGGHLTPDAHELEANWKPIAELDNAGTALHEFPGDLDYPVELPGSSPPASDQKEPTSEPKSYDSQEAPVVPSIEVTAGSQNVNLCAAFGPEPDMVDSPHPPASPSQGSNDHGARSPRSGSIDLALLSLRESGMEALTTHKTSSLSRHNSTYFVEDRRARLELRQSQENRLHPSMMPKVHTLVLTDVPTSTTDKEISHRIIQYIKDVAEETFMAKQRAKHTYALPPGRSRIIAEREHAHSIFALERIVLEMAPPQATTKKVSSGWRTYPTKSSTEDADSEAFWEAAARDFSFFGEEECGLPDSEPGRTLPLEAMGGLEVAPRRTTVAQDLTKNAIASTIIDVLDEISKFRKEKKDAFENLLRMGHLDPYVEGYWSGNITVIRPALNDPGELDCYGNRYESGWYYR
ncbi:hypothetical protein BDU57DRAFT_456434 [Ampelomyces quisqualis]|uniref:F-box domain-containing protein n=1 Tax=Ampelomyces quisqualis TaxID=50730 RepID=A0A6A5QEF3_AMPQU|nr:hypothetical protein BDU57DRAFT_456434 [Ampelomyces quisqualis]